jgi:lysyl-tRNA synthetase class 2
MEETNIPQESQELSAEQLSELLQIRRDKLSALREAGKDPFAVITFPQSHHSAEIVRD